MNFLLSILLVGLALAVATAASAADFSPEDSACQSPCAVHDAGAKAEPAAKPQQQGEHNAAARKASEAPAAKVAVRKPRSRDENRKHALAHQRVAR